MNTISLFFNFSGDRTEDFFIILFKIEINFNEFLLLTVLLTLVSIVEMKKFCQAFKEHNNSISYVFRRITSNDPYLTYLFIGQTYWRYNYNDGSESYRYVILNSFYGTDSNWFGDDYTTAFCVWFKSDKNCKTMLLSVIDFDFQLKYRIF